MHSYVMDGTQKLEEFLGTMMPVLGERDRRIFLGSLSLFLGHGSAKDLSEITGVTQQTISAGRKECKDCEKNPKARPSSKENRRMRAPGGGRKKLTEKNPGLEQALMSLMDGNVIGDPESTITWTLKSTTSLAKELCSKGFDVSHDTVGNLLKDAGFSLQQNKKYTESGNPGPHRDEQFQFIKDESEHFIDEKCPVISVDTKKKELIGNYKNNGREYRPKEEPRLVNDHDFMGPQGKAAPYGIYDVGANEGFVSVGISSDTAEFAVNSIRTWYELVGSVNYPDAEKIMITADCGGSNGRRNRLWKVKLQELANEKGLEIHVRHYPPGTSKWNKIEHRMFSHISMNWRGQPLMDLETIVSLISNTRTESGLTVQCKVDTNEYKKGIKVSDEEIDGLNIEYDHEFDDDGDCKWNYIIRPKS